MAWRNPYFDADKAHHRPEGFANPDPTIRVGGDFWRWQRERRDQGVPRQPVAGYEAFARDWSQRPDYALNGDRVWWLGHSTLLFNLSGVKVLTDPVLSRRASPLQFAGPQRRLPCVTTVADLPDIDIVLVSHNHYDHLDSGTIQQLARRSRKQARPIQFVVPLGLARLLREFGAQHVDELDWWQPLASHGLNVQAVPAQHWSARTLIDRNRTLWCGFVVTASDGHRIYFAGDTGYWSRATDIAERCGPIDLAALPIGAYAPRWFMQGQHINPAEAVQMHRELGIRRSIAIHWGTFELADDALDEPPVHLREALEQAGLSEQDFWLLKHGESRMLRA